MAILLAFAVFLAQVMRDDLDRELIRLAAAGARRRQRGLLLLLETVVPTLVGGVIGWIVGGLAVGALAATAGSRSRPIVGGALLAPAPLLAMTGACSRRRRSRPSSRRSRSGPRRAVVRSMVVVAVAVVGRAGLGGAVRGSARPRRPDLGPRQPGGRAPATGRDLPARLRARHVDATAPALGEPPLPRRPAAGPAVAALARARARTTRRRRHPAGLQPRRDRLRDGLVGEPSPRDRRRRRLSGPGWTCGSRSSAPGCPSAGRSCRSTATRRSARTSCRSRSTATPARRSRAGRSRSWACHRRPDPDAPRLARRLLGDPADRARRATGRRRAARRMAHRRLPHTAGRHPDAAAARTSARRCGWTPSSRPMTATARSSRWARSAMA